MQLQLSRVRPALSRCQLPVLQTIGAPLQVTAQALPASLSQSTASWKRCCKGSTVRMLYRSRRMHLR